MHEMLLENFIKSSPNPHTVAARHRVWKLVVADSQPTLLDQAMRNLSWFFAAPLRTAGFSVLLFGMVLTGGYLVPTHLESVRILQSEVDLATEISTLEQENYRLGFFEEPLIVPSSIF